MAQYTIAHSEINKGWNSFFSYVPDWFIRLGNNFYTVKNGQLWQHHDADNPIMNNFYGVQYGSSIKTVFNDAMANDKSYKTLMLESDQKWSAQLATNYTEGQIDVANYNTRESRQYAFIRQNENTADYSGGAVQGIGVITAISGATITFSHAPEFVNTGDSLLQINGVNEEVIGVITEVDGLEITVQAVLTLPALGFYAFAKKDARAEGGDIRGFYLEVLLENNETDQGDLFAISCEASKSFV